MRDCSVERHAQVMSMKISPEDQIMGRTYNTGPVHVYLLRVEDSPDGNNGGMAITAGMKVSM